MDKNATRNGSPVGAVAETRAGAGAEAGGQGPSKAAAVVKVAIVGASGYVGAELLRYLALHPCAKVVHCTASSQQGQPIEGLFPNLRGFQEGALESADWGQIGAECDLAFLCLPHGHSQQAAAQLLGQGCKVIDLSGDHRLKSVQLYAQHYAQEHTHPELLQEAVYGLPELNRARIKTARLIANPGCYPTASLLALLPLAQAGLLEEPAILDAKSGVSGAGRSLQVGSLFAEVNENLKPYALGTHRHQPEIEQALGQRVIFAPHLVPMTRGILVTAYVQHQPADLQELYESAYAGEPFVKVLGPGEPLPATKGTLGSNFCHLAVRPSGYPGRSVVVSAIDNLGKGAAGTAVHNMNLLFELPEEAGLRVPALYP